MKKISILFFILCLVFITGQKKKSKLKVVNEVITSEQALMSNNPQVIATFMKSNPNDSNIESLRTRLYELISPANDSEAKPTINTIVKNKSAKKSGSSTKIANQSKTEQALNHLLDSSTNKDEAYVQIVNKSKCNMIVKFSGKNTYYNLTVPANNDNFILINKGQYQLTTAICDAKYSSSKNITKDISITLKN